MKQAHSSKNTAANSRFSLADLEVDLKLRTVKRGATVLDVHDLTFDMFAFLIVQAPKTVSKDDVAQHVWRIAHVSEETLVQRVAILRRALGDTAKAPKYIRTVRGAGYSIACEVETLRLANSDRTGRQWRAKEIGLLAAVGAGLLMAGASWPSFQRVAEPSLEFSADTSISALQLARAKDLLALHQPLETDQAIFLLESALSEDTRSQELRLALSFAYSTRATKFEAVSTDIPGAENLARELISENMRLGRAWHALAYALDAQGRVDEAISSYQQAFSLDPSDVAAMSSAAYLFQIRGRYRDALDLEARALKIREPTLYAPIQIARTLSLLDHPASDAWWERALSSGLNHSVVLSEAMQEDLRRDDPERALQRLSKAPEAVQLTPRALRLSGRAHLKLGETEAARRAFEGAGYGARFESVSLALQLGEVSDAAALIEAAEAEMLEGDSWPELRVRLAEVYSSSGDTEAALRWLSRAVDLGWRDFRDVQTSPFFASLIKSERWKTIQIRIEREIAAQRELILAIEQSPTSDMINAPL